MRYYFAKKGSTFARRQQGITLIELLIASTMSILVISSVITLYINSHHSARTQSFTNQIQENGRFSILSIAEDVRMAKYTGLNLFPERINTNTVDGLVFGCGGPGWAGDIGQPLFAQNNSNPYSDSCIDMDNYKPGTDVLVLRHPESQPIASSAIKKNHLYLYTSLHAGEIFSASEKSIVNSDVVSRNPSQEPTGIYKMSSNVYYIRPCSDMSHGNASKCDHLDDAIPTLVRETLSTNNTITTPMVENVEDFQLSFGLDISTPRDFTVDRYVNADEVTDWNRVMSTKIFLLIRSPNEVAGYNDSYTYVLGDKTMTPKDGYHRKLFTQTVFIRSSDFDAISI